MYMYINLLEITVPHGDSFVPITITLPNITEASSARLVFEGDNVQVNQLGIGVMGKCCCW